MTRTRHYPPARVTMNADAMRLSGPAAAVHARSANQHQQPTLSCQRPRKLGRAYTCTHTPRTPTPRRAWLIHAIGGSQRWGERAARRLSHAALRSARVATGLRSAVVRLCTGCTDEPRLTPRCRRRMWRRAGAARATPCPLSTRPILFLPPADACACKLAARCARHEVTRAHAVRCISVPPRHNEVRRGYGAERGHAHAQRSRAAAHQTRPASLSRFHSPSDLL